jgi:hypothetical protein
VLQAQRVGHHHLEDEPVLGVGVAGTVAPAPDSANNGAMPSPSPTVTNRDPSAGSNAATNTQIGAHHGAEPGGATDHDEDDDEHADGPHG